ncbi:MAG TPA: magnesium transporter, partial [Firmicutes bacterium]|nr:magnesium transporter [Bacillota bacterium]
MSNLKIYQIIEGLRSGSHPKDLLDLIDGLTGPQKKELFGSLTGGEAASIVEEMEEHQQADLFRLLGEKIAPLILREMSSDDAVDLLGQLTRQEAQQLLEKVEQAPEYEGLLKYPEDTAGGIMTTELISLPADIPVEEAILRLREIAPRAETIYYVYVVDEESRLIGVLSLRDLIAATDGTLLKDIMRGNVISVHASLDQEEVARVVSRYDLLAVPVIDDQEHLLGIITVDDVLDVMEAEATEDIYKLAGTGELEGVELVDASVFQVVRHRLPWLMICMAGGFISGSVIGVFESTLEAIFVLAVFIPVIMDMGGNVGTQSSTIFIRGLATGEIKASEVRRYFLREIKIGATIGLVCGGVVSAAAILWQGSMVLGLVVGVSMMSTVVLAAFIGILVPLLFDMAGLDPAITSGPLVTTIKDVTGLLVYFGI